jgi:hypothetical protein
MNRYQFLMLACLYAALAYGAHLERKENDNTFGATHYWQVGFVFCSASLGAAILISIFIFLGAL